MNDHFRKTLIAKFIIEARFLDSHIWLKWDAKVTSVNGVSEYCRGFHHSKKAAIKCGKRKARRMVKEDTISNETPNAVTYEVYK